jgi:hypothetical protein
MDLLPLEDCLFDNTSNSKVNTLYLLFRLKELERPDLYQHQSTTNLKAGHPWPAEQNPLSVIITNFRPCKPPSPTPITTSCCPVYSWTHCTSICTAIHRQNSANFLGENAKDVHITETIGVSE